MREEDVCRLEVGRRWICCCVAMCWLARCFLLLVIDSRQTEGQMPFLATVEVDGEEAEAGEEGGVQEVRTLNGSYCPGEILDGESPFLPAVSNCNAVPAICLRRMKTPMCGTQVSR